MRVPRDAGADVDPLHETVLAQQVEYAVHAGDPDLSALRPEGVEDLLRRQAAVLPAEQLDDGPPGDAVSATAVAQPLERLQKSTCLPSIR